MSDAIQLIIGLTATFTLLGVGFFNGRRVERSHLRDIARREEAVRHLIVTNTKFIPPELDFKFAEMLTGEVVIASDYFKNFAAGIRGFFGGRVRSLETLLERARREAILRVLEQAAAKGAVAVFNIRLETTNIGTTQGKKQAAMGEMVAYGTACYAARHAQA